MKEKVSRKTTVFEAYLAVIFMLTVICLGSVVFKMNVNIMLVICIAFNMFMCWRCNVSLDAMIKAINDRIGSMGVFVLILMGIGFLIGSLMVAGTIPVLVAWLSQLVVPKYALVSCLVLVSILAFTIGSSFASLGTLGIVMFSVATLQGMDPAIAAAACICGANFGQYISPIADLPNLAASVNKTSIYQFMKDLSLPMGISFIISAVFYVVMGHGVASPDALNSVNALVANIYDHFNSNPLVILPIVVAIVLSIKKCHTLLVLYGSGFVAMLIGIFLQGFPIAEVINAAYDGFSTQVMFPGVTLHPIIETLLNRGGIVSMAGTCLFLLMILACVGLLEVMGSFEVIKETAFKKAENGGVLALVTTVFGMFFGLITCEPYSVIVVTSEVAREPYIKAGFEPRKVGIIAMACAQLTGYLVPWSVLAMYCVSVLGVSALAYAPYALLFTLMPIVILILSFLGIGNPKLAPEQKV